MVVTYMDTLYYNGLFLEQLETQGTIFQLAYNNTIYYTVKPDGLLVTVLILPECTNSSYKAARTVLGRTAPDIIILICSTSPNVLVLILSK